MTMSCDDFALCAMRVQGRESKARYTLSLEKRETLNDTTSFCNLRPNSKNPQAKPDTRNPNEEHILEESSEVSAFGLPADRVHLADHLHGSYGVRGAWGAVGCRGEDCRILGLSGLGADLGCQV